MVSSRAVIDVESAPDKPLPREIALATGQPRINNAGAGRETGLDDTVAQQIIGRIAQGAFLKPACEASGIAYQTMREWVRRGLADAEAGLDTRYARFADGVSRAQSQHQNELAATFTRGGDGKYPDWRAQAFLAERRYEHWRLPKEQGITGLTLQLSNEQLSALGQALKIAAQPAIDVESSEEVSTTISSANK